MLLGHYRNAKSDPFWSPATTLNSRFPLFSVIVARWRALPASRMPRSSTLIEELRSQHAVLTGTTLRAELKARHGTPCGVSRIYRLLHTATLPQAAPAAAPSSTADRSAELAEAVKRAELAEYREEHHQARWASEIHSLREQVHALRDAGHRLPILEQQLLDRSRELAAAYKRISDLEAQLEP